MYQFSHDEQGSAAIEYSLFISLIGMVLTSALYVLGANLFDAFSAISQELPSILVNVESSTPH